MRGLRDALDFRLQRDTRLAQARRLAAGQTQNQAAMTHAFVLEKMRQRLGLAFADCDPADWRALPAWLPGTEPRFAPPSSPSGQAERLLAWIQTTTQQLEGATGQFQAADLHLLMLGLAHLSTSEQIIALEVLAAIRWFDLNRRKSPHVPALGESVTAIVSGQTDEYPTGGIDSIAQRGPWENLVPSELVYLDDDWPSLFEVRWLNQELLFHGRDESVHRRPVLDLWIRVDPSVGDRLDQPHDLPHRIAAMTLGWFLSLVLRLRQSFGAWDFRIAVEALTILREIRPGQRREDRGFLSFLDPLAHRLGFEQGDPRANSAQLARPRHKLILMDLGGLSEGMKPDLWLVLDPPKGVLPPVNALCRNHPQTAAGWLEMDETLMERIVREISLPADSSSRTF